ncbi:MAG: glutamine--fructose-6-phosphate transaminase (isomerizing) [Elusimicrobiota bacterium]|nr:glutamine--fructose-6-phosphate transaminase (isomerizing) [Endomicrobiia bacterium]MDW8165734.1 glutamine--fructose-6-phosphate transaminase (isomerizing) [Elusimicrobiota bacterium]
MCGIIGYIGKKNIVDVLISGLKKLEYRGYDSSGIAILKENKIIRHRSVGKISQMEASLPSEFKNLSSKDDCIGIAHTRWATHGKPSEENAHPHIDCTKSFVLVHNGIIENYFELKTKLKKHKFLSDTDTEVIVHLIEENYNGSLIEAVKKTLKLLEGSYAFVLLSKYDPKKLFFARKDSPLIIGLAEDEKLIASDVTAMLEYTNKFIFLENEDFGEVSAKDIKIFNLKRDSIQQRPITLVNWSAQMAEKSGFKHFMLKEIYEQPQVLRENITSRVFGEDIIFDDELKFKKDLLKKIEKILIIGCGTSYHAGLVCKYFFENILKIPTEVDIASEFRYRNPILKNNTLAIFISQSGETADTLASLRLIKRYKLPTLGICNVVGSSLYREADSTIYIRCGPEIGVASTKAFTGQLISLYLFGLYLAKIKKTTSHQRYIELLNSLYKTPTYIENILSDTSFLKHLAELFYSKKDFLYLARGINYPVALEGALKLKEISYIHAEGYPAGEMKHGPIALIDKDMPVVIIATKGALLQKVFSNLEEVKSRDAKVIALTNYGVESKSIDYKIILPETDELISPILNVVPLQLLAYYIADILGCDIDQPRNLAKSVTVE